MIKKRRNAGNILNTVLSIILAFSILPVYSAFAEEDEFKTEKVEQEKVYGKDSYELLNALKIADIKEEELALDATRGEVLISMAKAAGFEAFMSEEKVFSDMETTDEREPYIKALYKLGVIRPDSKGNIYPDGKITLQEAAAIAVKLTGYGIVAEANGGYPAGYLRMAKRYDMLLQLPNNGSTVLKNGMAAKLIENMLKTKVMVQNYFANGSSEYTAEAGGCLLYTVFKVKWVEGIVEAVDISQIAGGNETDTDYAIIGGEKLYVSSVENIYDYLGYNVDAYYVSDRGSDVAKLILIRKSDLNTETLIDVDDITDVSDGRIKFVEDNSSKEKAYNFKNTLPVIYNGISTRQSFSKALLNGRHGKIRLLDNTGDGGYDIIFVDVYENFVASDIIKQDSKVYDKYDNTHSIVLDLAEDDPFVWIYDMTGKKVSLDKVKRNSVLSIFSSASDAAQGYIRAYVNSESQSGIITQVKNDNIIIVDDVEYEITAACAEKCAYYIKTGAAISFKKDFGGKIAYIENNDNADDYEYGFIVKVAKLKGVDYKLQFKIYTVRDSFEIYDIADRFKIDSIVYKSSDITSILERLNKASGAMFNKVSSDGTITEQVPNDCYSSLVRYKLNDDGKLYIIDTILNSETGVASEREDESVGDDALFMQYAENALYRGTMLGGKIAFTTEAPLMSYPSPLAADPDTGLYFDMGDKKHYSVTNAYRKFSNDSSYSIYGFYNGGNNYVSRFLGTVYDPAVSEAGADYRTPLSVVSDLPSEIYDEKEEMVVECLNVNGSEQIPVESGFSFTDDDGVLDPALPRKMTIHDLKKGDIIKYTRDSLGYLSDLQLVYRIEEKKYVDKSDMYDLDMHWGSVQLGYVYLKFEGGMLIYVPSDMDTFSPTDMSQVKARDCVMVVTEGRPTVWKYETGRSNEYEVKNGSLDDLKAFKDVGLECSRIMIQRYYTGIKAIVEF